MEYLRKNIFVKINKKGINGLRDAIQYVKNGHSIALMIDQRVSEGEKVDFLVSLHLLQHYLHNYL